MINPTNRQLEIYRFLQIAIERDHLAPTIRETAIHFSVYPNAIVSAMKWMEKKGMLKRDERKIRRVILTYGEIA